MNQDSQTSATLLLRLRHKNDQEAWNELVERYAPRIVLWCRNFKLQDSDTADVTQDVLTKLVTAMQNFDYDPASGSFRGWLKTVTSNAVRDWARSRSRSERGMGAVDEATDPLISIVDPHALTELNRVIEDGHQAEILREAETRVQLRVKPTTWRAYELTAIKQTPVKDVAKTLGITVAEVYVCKSRVLKLLRETVEQLDGVGAA